jgi:hypothetical protein
MNHNPDIPEVFIATTDILDRLHHAQPLARGPYRRLINDSIIEIQRLRALLTQQENPVNHNPDTKQHPQ